MSTWRRPTTPSVLAVALGTRPSERGPAAIVGLEHEYSLSVAGERLDFRELIHDLPIAGRRLDPGDLNAYRLASGLVLTCDAEDAEVVSPPVPVRPGFTVELDTWAGRGRAELAGVLPPEIGALGFSTHLSASMPQKGPAVCARFARAFAPAVMLMLDRPDSHGVFVRPRPGRIELCGEHATGARLRAAAALVVGGARACAVGTTPGGSDTALPPLLAVGLRPATGRPGLFVGRHVGFGFDLTPPVAKRSFLWRAAAVSVHSPIWSWPGTQPGPRWAPMHPTPTSMPATGWSPVRFPWGWRARPTKRRPQFASPPSSPFGEMLEPRRRPRFHVRPEAATWDFTIFRLSGAGRHAFACVPRRWLPNFLEGLDAGRLDGLLGGFLEAPQTGTALTHHDQTLDPDLWHDAVIGPDLLPYEQTDADSPLISATVANEESGPAVY